MKKVRQRRLTASPAEPVLCRTYGCTPYRTCQSFLLPWLARVSAHVFILAIKGQPEQISFVTYFTLLFGPVLFLMSFLLITASFVDTMQEGKTEKASSPRSSGSC